MRVARVGFAFTASLFLGVPAIAQPVQGAPSEQTSETLWRIYAKEIIDLSVGEGADVNGFQMLPVLETISVEKGPVGNYQRIKSFCEPIPAISPFYERTTIMLSDVYGSYLRSLSYPNVPPEKRAEIERLRTEYLKSTSDANKLAQRRGREWKEFSDSEKYLDASKRTPFDVWYARDLGKKVGSAENAVSIKASAWANAVAEAYGGYQDVTEALLLFENAALKVPVTDQSGLTTHAHSCSIGSEEALADFIKGGEANIKSGLYAFDSVLTTDKGQKTVETWKVSARGGWGSFLGGRGNYERTKISEDDRKFSMSVKFRNFTRLPLIRDAWYRGSIVALVNEPKQFVKNGITNPEKLWGASGIWQLLPSHVIVGYKPSIKISFSAKDYDYLFQKWSGGGGFAVGNFWIGGKGSGSKEKTTWDNQAKSLAIEYDTTDVFAIAVVNAFMPKGTTATPKISSLQ